MRRARGPWGLVGVLVVSGCSSSGLVDTVCHGPGYAAPPACTPTVPVTPTCDQNAGDFSGDTATPLSVFQWPNHRFVGTSFVAGAEAGAVCAASLLLSKVQAPAGRLYVSLWSNDARAGLHVPGTKLAESAGVEAASIAGRGEVRFTGLSGASLVQGTKYWLVLRSDAPAASDTDHVLWSLQSVSTTSCDTVNSPTDQAGSWQCYQWAHGSLRLFK